MKPGVKTIIAGTVLFVLGAFVIPLLFILPLILGGANELQFRVPGTIQAVVDEPGSYYLWNDYETVYFGKSYNRSKTIPDGTEIRIRNENGEQLAFVSDKSISESSGSSSKNSIGYVTVQKPGKINIEVTGGSEERIFSFSRSRVLKFLGILLGGFSLSMLFAIGGLSIAIWGIIKLIRGNKNGEKDVAQVLS
jgi:hypothetical protein